MSIKTKTSKPSATRSVGNESESYDESNYKLKISEHSNYLKFLKMTDEAVASDDDGSHGDMDGYIEDDIMGDMLLSECDMNADISDLTEADENMYPDLNSPTLETIEPTGQGANGQTTTAMTEEEKQRQMEEWKEELARVEGEIQTLRQVLGSKVRYASELKRKMGITPFQELKQDFQIGIKSIQNSDTYQKTNVKFSNLQSRITTSSAYQKTNEKLHDINDKITHSNAYQKTTSAVKTASEKTNAAVSSAASAVSKKLGDIRNSGTFKSMEEKVGGAYASVKAKVTGSKSENESFESALMEAANNENKTANSDSSLPEEKVPL